MKLAKLISNLSILILITAHSAFAGGDPLTTSGDIGQIAAPAFAAGLSALKGDWEGEKQFTLDEGSTMALTYILKPTIDRKRPNGGSESFPSGHASTAFGAASYLENR